MSAHLITVSQLDSKKKNDPFPHMHVIEGRSESVSLKKEKTSSSPTQLSNTIPRVYQIEIMQQLQRDCVECVCLWDCINLCLFVINLNIYHVLGVTYVVLTSNVIKATFQKGRPFTGLCHTIYIHCWRQPCIVYDTFVRVFECCTHTQAHTNTWKTRSISMAIIILVHFQFDFSLNGLLCAIVYRYTSSGRLWICEGVQTILSYA